MIKKLFEHIDLKDSLHGNVTITKAGIMKSNDPDQLRKEISEQYTEAVQKYPELEFDILVDKVTDEIRISWKRII